MLAIHNYHDAHKSLPAGAGGMGAWVPTIGVTAYTLPYNEQGAMYETMVAYGQSAGARAQIQPLPTGQDLPQASGQDATGADDIILRAALRQVGPISAYLCPSDGNARQMSTVNTFGDSFGGAEPWLYSPRSCMMPSHGDAINDNGINPWTTGVWRAHGSAGRGAFMPYSWKSLGACVDGTSNTLGAGETCTSGMTGDIGTGNELKGGVASSQPGLSACLAQSPDRRTLLNPRSGIWRGRILLLGTPDNRMSTVLPPNSPSCHLGAVPDGMPPNFAFGVFPPSSNHTGGVNCGVLDGSVHFISDTINYLSGGVSSLDAPGLNITSGQSPFGVWGALGSLNGGESVSLP